MRQCLVICSVCLALMIGCEGLFFEQEPAADSPVENFMSLWTTFNERYAPFEQRNVDWLQIFEAYRPEVNERTNESELYGIMTEMLSVLDDAHVTLTAPFRPVWNANRVARLEINNEFFKLEIVKAFYLSDIIETDPFVIGTIDRSRAGQSIQIGYIYIQSFESKRFSQIEVPFRRSVIGIIVDLRHNGGGDFRNGLQLASKFADVKRLAFSTVTKNGQGPKDFAPAVDWYIEPNESNLLRGPIVVLTDRYTVSAAERAVLALKVLPNVTTMGDTTSGAFGEKIGKELPNGWKYSLTPQIVFAANGVSYDGMGIPPDVYVRPILFTDFVLSRAIDFLLANDGGR